MENIYQKDYWSLSSDLTKKLVMGKITLHIGWSRHAAGTGMKNVVCLGCHLGYLCFVVTVETPTQQKPACLLQQQPSLAHKTKSYGWLHFQSSATIHGQLASLELVSPSFNHSHFMPFLLWLAAEKRAIWCKLQYVRTYWIFGAFNLFECNGRSFQYCIVSLLLFDRILIAFLLALVCALVFLHVLLL